MTTELEALQTFAERLGMEVWQRHDGDRRRTSKYYATLNGATCSPVLDYENLNHFLLGWNNCIKHTTK